MGKLLIVQAKGGTVAPPVYLVDRGAGGGLWRRSGPGAWTQLRAGTAYYEVQSPYGTPAVLYLSALNFGGSLYRSLDSGASWTDLGAALPATGGNLQNLSVADGDGSHLYIGDDDVPTVHLVARVWESLDFGATWSAIEIASDDHDSDQVDMDVKDGPLLWIAQMSAGGIYQNPFTTDALTGGSQRYGIVNKLRGSDYVVYGPSPDTFSDEPGLLPTEPSTSSVAYVTRRKTTDDTDKVGFTIPAMIAGLAALPLTRCHPSQALLVTATTLVTMFAVTTFVFDGVNYDAVTVEIDVFLETVGGAPVNTLSLSGAVPTSLGAVDARQNNFLWQDPNHPLSVWAYIGAVNLYHSADGGLTWAAEALVGPTHAPQQIMVAG